MRNNDHCLAPVPEKVPLPDDVRNDTQLHAPLQQAYANEAAYTDALPDLPVQLLPGAAVLAQPLPQPMCILPQQLQQPLMQQAQHQQQQALPFSSPEHSQESAASLRAPQVH